MTSTELRNTCTNSNSIQMIGPSFARRPATSRHGSQQQQQQPQVHCHSLAAQPTMRIADGGSGAEPGAAAPKTPLPVAEAVVPATSRNAEKIDGAMPVGMHDSCTNRPQQAQQLSTPCHQCGVDARNRNNTKKKLALVSRLVLLLTVGILGSTSKQQHRRQQDGNLNPDGGTASFSSGAAARWTPLPTADAAPIAKSTAAASVIVGEDGDIQDLVDNDDSREGDDESRSVERYRTLDDYLADVSGSPRRKRTDGGSSDGSEDDVIVVATVDGTMAGISRSSGRTLWKRTGSSATTTTINDTAATATPTETSPPSEAPNLDTQVGLFAPLVSTTTTTKSGSGSGRGGDWRTAAVPSVDGRVYLTPGRDKNLPADVAAATAVTTAKELVGRAPFVDARGRFYVGSRTATAAALDRDTGEILRLVGGDGTTSGVVDENGEEFLPSLEGRNIVWVGRTDYSVSVFDARTGDVDVRFSTSEVLSVGDMFRGGQIGSGSGEADDAAADEIWDDTINGMNNPLPSLPGSERFGGAPFDDHRSAYIGDEDDEDGMDGLATASLIATPSGNLALRDPNTGEVAWVSDATFETPVAYAVDSSDGQSINVNIVPDAAVPCDDKEYVKEELERQLAQMEGRILGDDAGLPKEDGRSGQAKSGASTTTADETIVGALDSGQLFAMPLGNTKRSNYKGHRQPFLPGLPRPLPSSRTQQGGGAASQASSRQWHRGPGPRHHAHAVGGDSGDWQHSQQQQQQQPRGVVNDATSTSLAMINSACRPGQPNFPSCLVGSRLNQPQRKWKDYDGDGVPDGDGSFLDPNNQMLDPRSDAALKALMMTGYHLNPDYFDGSLWNDPDLFDEERSRQQQRSRFKAFLRIMSSWVPPAVALAFVVSFELGRRERLKAEKLLLEKVQGDADADSEISLTRALAADEEVRSRGVVGAIKVSDIVLGYGGHGTVVYKGSLDGRSIAVKRMLKTYHASANREISLLIESDGHPNVVRYFLKEVRGDFVYLALELCDMSLHELIAALGEHKYWRKEKPSGKKRHGRDVGSEGASETGDAISLATRDMLLQIASGVRHLHSLRIVHRDLKPQNILLAHQDRNKQTSDPKTNFEDRDPTDTHKEETNESIYEAFEEGQYVPKISDMGLGKQLMGQSSFGLSTLGNASAGLAATGAGGQSKDVAGAGPGSVGWQAPEVMAQRRLPEGRALSMSLTRTCSDAGGANPSYDNPTGELIDSSPMEVDLPTAAVRTSRSVDIFSLGCIFYCTIIPGSHPFGEWYEREANIMKNEPSTIALEKISAEASDLVCSMIARDPKQRPTAAQVCLHPFFWDAGRRLAFLCQLSDRLEATSPTLTDSSDASVQQHTNVDPFLVERNAATVVGTSWDKNLDQGLLSNVSRFRTYDPSSVRDLLRLIRNKYHHFDELPEEVKMRLGPNPTDLITYFERVFPGLVMHCFRVCRDNLAEDDPLVHKFHIPSRLGTGTSPSSSAAPNRMSADDARQSELPITIDANVSLDDTSSTTSPSNKNAGTPKNASYYKLLASTQSSLTATENEDPKERPNALSATAAGIVDDKVTSFIPPEKTTDETLLSSAQLPPTTVKVEKVGEDSNEIATDTIDSPRTRPQKVAQEIAELEQIPNTLSSTIGTSSSISVAAESKFDPTTALQDDLARGSNEAPKTGNAAEGMVIWEGSTAAKTFNCRGWYRSEDEWVRRVDSTLRKRDANVSRCATDPKFRTRLCNHWDSSQGTHCPMRRKKKCIFAHGPVELRVKESKRNRWGKLVDSEGNCSNPKASGGEDTYGAARSIEAMREKEGKWTPNKRGAANGANNSNTGRYRGKQSGDGGSKKSTSSAK